MAIHSQAAKHGCESNIFVATALINMYAKCGSLLDARRAFDRMSYPDCAAWNALILGYVDNGRNEMAMELFHSMQISGNCSQDSRTFVAALKACANLAEKEQAKQVDGKLVKVSSLATGAGIYSQAARAGYNSSNNSMLWNSLVNMYAKCGSMVDARRVFEEIPRPDVVSWTALLMGYAENGESELALRLFAKMQDKTTRGACVNPNSRTFLAALTACSYLAVKEEGRDLDGKLVKMVCLEKAMAIHSQAAAACDQEAFVGSRLIDLYGKCGSLMDARRVFDRMKHHDVVSWTALILGYAENGENELALELFAWMQTEGCCTPDVRAFVAAAIACGGLSKREVMLDKLRDLEYQACSDEPLLANTLVDLYAKCGSLDDARRVFEEMKSRDVVSWTVAILGHVQNGQGEAALDLFARMRRCIMPDCQALAASLMACAAVASLERGRSIQAEIYRYGLEHDPAVVTCLVDLYGKCGNMAAAQHIVDSSSVKVEAGTWNALLAGYSRRGDPGRAFESFEKMRNEDVEVDEVTFVSLLAACSHAGLVYKGRQCFVAMSSVFGICPTLQHYACMIDLLSRGNHLEEALDMARSMPFEVDVVTWMTILAACSKWQNAGVGKIAFESLLRSDSGKHHPAAYELMANIHLGHS